MRRSSIAMLAIISLLPVAVTHAQPAPGHATHSVGATEATTESPRVSRIRLRSGVALEVTEVGRADATPVLFLHGYTDSRLSFSRLVPLLPSDVRAIIPSQRGHGNSDRPSCCYRPEDFAKDAIELLDALGIPAATVVGHSMGSFVAMRMALTAPERVTRLVLIGSGYSAQIPSVKEFSEAVGKLTDPLPVEFVREFQQSTIGEPVPAQFFEQVISESMKVPARVWRDALNGLVAAPTVGDLTRIRVPTLIVWGDKDAIFDRSLQERLQLAIAGSTLQVYEGIGHSPIWERPDRVASDLKAFLADDTGPQRSAGSSHEAHGKEHAPAAHGHSTNAVMPLLEGYGTWHLGITTRAVEAQRYFDQGLRLVYAFNHDEAVRSFERAIALDDTCAMCHWGLAWALGPNINLPLDPAVEPRALAAAKAAVERREAATPFERLMIEAIATRYGMPSANARAPRDSAFARAMRIVARQFPNHADAQVIFADAMLNLRPWNQWTRDGRPQPGTEELVSALEKVLARTPQHPGACHLYIHAVEASTTPARALPCAERLPRLMPGAGHVVHMPAHVYLRVGRYEDAAQANITAVEADRRYFAERGTVEGMYPLVYAPHNWHFLWATYLFSGQQAKALDAARNLQAGVRVEDARGIAFLQEFLATEVLTHARFGAWNAVLATPKLDSGLQFVTGMWTYARGLAFAAQGDMQSASLALDSVRAMASRLPADMIIGVNPAPALLQLASEVLAGRIAAEQGQFDRAITHLRTAVRLEDEFKYIEPPAWYHPTRNMLGETLLAAGRPQEAEAAFREDLRYVPETGWSLDGLLRALESQSKTGDVNDVSRRLVVAWKYADGPAARGR